MLAVGLALTAFAACVLVAPLLPFAPVAGFAVAFVVLAVSVIGVAVATPALPWRALAAVPIPIAAVAAATLLPASSPFAVGLVDAGLLVGGCLIGGVVGCHVERPGHLLVVAYVASLADVFSVFGAAGPSSAIVSDQRMLALLALSWPMLGTGGIEPMLGIGDVMMTALFVAAVRRHGLGLPRVAVALFAAYLVVVLALVWFERALPALPFLAVGVLVAVPAARKLDRKEWRTAIVGMLVLTTVFAALVLR